MHLKKIYIERPEIEIEWTGFRGFWLCLWAMLKTCVYIKRGKLNFMVYTKSYRENTIKNHTIWMIAIPRFKITHNKRIQPH